MKKGKGMADRIRISKIDAFGLTENTGANLWEFPWWDADWPESGGRWGENGGYRKYGDSTLKIGRTFLEGRPSEIREFIDFAEGRFWDYYADGNEAECIDNFGWHEVPPALLPNVIRTAKEAVERRVARARDALDRKLDKIVKRLLPGFKNYTELEREVKAGFTPTLRDDIDPEFAALRDALDHAVNDLSCHGDPYWRLAVCSGGSPPIDWRSKKTA